MKIGEKRLDFFIVRSYDLKAGYDIIMFVFC